MKLGGHITAAVVLAMVSVSVAAAPGGKQVTTGRTGRFELTFSERSPHSATEEVMTRTEVDFFDPIWIKSLRPEYVQGLYDKQKVNWAYNLAEEPFVVIVPAGYDRATPHGLFVWMGLGDIPDTWLDALARQKLICVSAKSGAERVSLVREGLALDAVHNMKSLYSIDDNRVFVAGFGSGAQIAAWMVRAWPDVFAGGYFLNGGWFYKANILYTAWYFERSEREGGHLPDADTQSPAWKTSEEWPMERIKTEKKLVLLRGANDDAYVTEYSPKNDRLQYDGLLLDGFARAQYIEVPALGHEMPSAEWFEKGLSAIEAEPNKSLPTTAPTNDPNPLPSQILQAKRLLQSAQHSGLDDRIRRMLQQILRDYPTTPAAAQKGMDRLHLGPKKPPKS